MEGCRGEDKLTELLVSCVDVFVGFRVCFRVNFSLVKALYKEVCNSQGVNKDVNMCSLCARLSDSLKT